MTLYDAPVPYAGVSSNALPTTFRYRMWGRVFRLVSRLLSRTTTDPLPDLEGKRIVFVANHSSFSDVFYAVAVLSDWRYPARCLVRYSYFKPPLVGRWLRTLLCVPAGGGGTDAVTEGVEILKDGWPVAVMVEGRIVRPEERAPDGMGEFRDGFITIARKADAWILPITIANAPAVWPAGGWPKLPLRGRPEVRVSVGTPFSPDGLVDSEAIAAARSQMAEMLARS
ncbi:MAG: lysophospholipid acyltransferase family protein [Actinomycetota bacterium]